MSTNHIRKSIFSILLITVSGVALLSCISQEMQNSRLRIINNGSHEIKNLVVRFPEDQVAFGNVPAGETTKYIEVPNGVYRYAAYQFEINGEIVSQPVVDWVGENPMNGILFTYTIDFDPNRMETRDWWIRLIDVKNDD